MDEATLSGNNEVYELNENGDITHYFINAKDYGLKVTVKIYRVGVEKKTK